MSTDRVLAADVLIQELLHSVPEIHIGIQQAPAMALAGINDKIDLKQPVGPHFRDRAVVYGGANGKGVDSKMSILLFRQPITRRASPIRR